GGRKGAGGVCYSPATDLADWLVQTLRLPFREAHHITGRIVAAAEQAGVPLEKLPLSPRQAGGPRTAGHVFNVLSVNLAAGSRTTQGGTAPANVRREAAKW